MEKIDWIHPSYRDLMIDELAKNASTRKRFLNSMSIRGVKLAISDAGGASGKRKFPFLIDGDSWRIFKQRCIELVSNISVYEQQVLLTALIEAVNSSSENQKELILGTLLEVLSAIKKYWDNNSIVLNSHTLSVYVEASLLIVPLAQMPRLDASWYEKHKELHDTLEEYEDKHYFLDYSMVNEWANFIEEIKLAEPRFFKQINFPGSYLDDIQRFIDIAHAELGIHDQQMSQTELDDAVDKFEAIINILSILMPFLPHKHKNAASLKREFEEELSSLRIRVRDNEDEYEDLSYINAKESDDFDIDSLFNDL